MNEVPTILPIKGGWAAIGKGWAVHGKTKEDAIQRFQEAMTLHSVIDIRARSQTEGKEMGTSGNI